MAEVAPTAGTGDLGPGGSEAPVLVLVDGSLVESAVEARPSRAGLEFGVALEQISSAAGTGEHAGSLDVEELSGPGRLGALLTQHRVTLGRELRPPLLVAQLHRANGLGLRGVTHGLSPRAGRSGLHQPRVFGHLYKV